MLAADAVQESWQCVKHYVVSVVTWYLTSENAPYDVESTTDGWIPVQSEIVSADVHIAQQLIDASALDVLDIICQRQSRVVHVLSLVVLGVVDVDCQSRQQRLRLSP